MGTPGPSSRTSLLPMAIAAGAAVLCCAGPVLLAVLATTGIGAVAARSGMLVAGAGVAVVLIIGLVWWRRRSCACAAVSEPHGSPDESSHNDEGPALSSRRT